MPSFLLANVQSIANKIDDFHTVIRSNNIDIACLTESWLNNCVPAEATEFEGYTTYRHDRQDGRQGGGVMCVIKECISSTRLHHLETPDVESLWLLVRLTKMPRKISHIAVGIIYHPPTANNATTVNHILTSLDKISQDHPYAGIMLLGDFNRMRDSAVLSYPLKQLVKVSTRKANILDKIYTNINNQYNKPLAWPPIANSDHNTILMFPSRHWTDPRDLTTTFVLTRSKDHNSKIMLAHELEKFNWTELYRLDSCEAKLLYFNSTIHYLLDKYLPLRLVKKHIGDKPWIDENFKALIRRRQYAWTHKNMAEYRQYRNKVQRAARSLRAKYYRRQAQGIRKCNPRKWWQEVKRITNQSASHPLDAMADLFDGDTCRLANEINVFMQSVSSDLKAINPDLLPKPDDVCPDEFIIEPYAVERKLSKVDARKSSGPDDIPNWFIKEFSVWLAEPLSAIFNASVRQGTVPQCWKTANVVPLPKVNPPKVISKDLRPISLTPTLSKVLESFVGSWIMNTIVEKLDTRQYGCIKGRSTTHELVDIIQHWQQALDKEQSVRALFIDFAKAFDHVDHTIVVNKLHSLGVPNTLLRWLCSFLSNRLQRVKLSQVFSDWIELTGGMPQGSWLGPLIFITLIDDLSAQCLVHKYVDDTTLSELLTRGSTSAMAERLQEVLNWSNQNMMNINYGKTKEMLLGSIRKDTIPYLIDNNNEAIERVTVFKLLGLTIDKNLKWNSHVNSICTKASSRLFFLKQLKRSSVTVDDLLYFYCTVVRPILEYACPVWHSSLTKELSDCIERIQKRAMYIIFGAGKYNDTIQKHNIDTLHDRREMLCKKFFIPILSPNNCLHYLLPEPRDIDVTIKLRNANVFIPETARTNRFKNSFIQYGLEHYQQT